MDVLPVELLTEILTYLPPSSRKNTRLTSRSFNQALPKSDFSLLGSFIDPEVAIATIEATAADLTKRPRTIWSPRCSVPEELPIPESFLLAMYIGLSGRRWRRRVDARGRTVPRDAITVGDMAMRLGRADITEDVMRQAMFRYVLYLSYTSEGGETPHMWVVNPKPLT